MQLADRLFVATAGWSVPRQHATLAARDGTGLQKYASILGAVEINSTFYRRHQLKTFERWRASVPKAFRFAVKLPRWITHDAALAAPREALAQFFDDVSGLAEKLGPVLVQLPPSLEFNARRSGAFFRILRSLHGGPVACEPRHSSWYASQPSAIFSEYGVARVVADPPRPVEGPSTWGLGIALVRSLAWLAPPVLVRLRRRPVASSGRLSGASAGAQRCLVRIRQHGVGLGARRRLPLRPDFAASSSDAQRSRGGITRLREPRWAEPQRGR